MPGTGGGLSTIRTNQVMSDITDDSTFDRQTNEGSRELQQNVTLSVPSIKKYKDGNK